MRRSVVEGERRMGSVGVTVPQLFNVESRAASTELLGSRGASLHARIGEGSTRRGGAGPLVVREGGRTSSKAGVVRRIQTKTHGGRKSLVETAESGRVTLQFDGWFGKRESAENVRTQRVLMEYMDEGSGTRKLGVVLGPVTRAKWRLVSSDGELVDVGRQSMTFQWPESPEWLEGMAAAAREDAEVDLSEQAGQLQAMETSLRTWCESNSSRKTVDAVWELLRAHQRDVLSESGMHSQAGTSTGTVSAMDLLTALSQANQKPLLFPEDVEACALPYAAFLFLSANASHFKASMSLQGEHQARFHLRSPRAVQLETARRQRLQMQGEAQAQRLLRFERRIRDVDYRSRNRLVCNRTYRGSLDVLSLAKDAGLEGDEEEAVLEDERLAWDSKEDASVLLALRQYALQHEMSNSVDVVDAGTSRQVLSALGRQTRPIDAVVLLIQLGVWTEDVNLSRLRSTVPLAMPKWATEAQPHGVDVDVELGLRTEVNVPLFAIDDASTKEVDDAIGYERTDDGRELVHIVIADATRFINAGDRLDELARSRVATAYLPEGSFTMLPTWLSHQAMSLKSRGRDGGEEPTCGLAFTAELRSQPLHSVRSFYSLVQRFDVRPVHLSNVVQCTYGQVDRVLRGQESEMPAEHQQALRNLHRVAQARFKGRADNGAVNIDFPETNVRLFRPRAGSDSRVMVIDAELPLYSYKQRPSQQLVSEMMIMTGEMTASFAKEHDIPVPFRSQALPDVSGSEQSDLYDAGCAQSDWAVQLTLAYNRLRTMQAARTGVVPQPHAGLGIDMYSQSTSPIRRYKDLLVHHQFKAFLRSGGSLARLPFSSSDIERMLPYIEERNQEITELQRASERFWLMSYLQRHGYGKRFPAVVLDPFEPNDELEPMFDGIDGPVALGQMPQRQFGTVLLPTLGLRTTVGLSREQPLMRGEELSLCVDGVNAHRGRLFFRVAPPPRRGRGRGGGGGGGKGGGRRSAGKRGGDSGGKRGGEH